jgi:chromosome segregation protein
MGSGVADPEASTQAGIRDALHVALAASSGPSCNLSSGRCLVLTGLLPSFVWISIVPRPGSRAVRLTQIKLSGFKSFVDPTQFSLPGRLVGVVGPNGCGKSNIIDAARWVLGESKASELRGESMQDVIFNGSGQRKPAGRASVELVFDNTPDANGKIVAGPWGQYAEIAVKRVLTRDGTSSYLINNQAVRRRDIQDIFLGTGLGPRAYAIIGQGMISRIIEARPDELRVFLEEAAGISKYKERRRETETRLSDTRENLTRVEDILRELTANLDRLESQAVVAQQYRDLETEVDGKQKLLWLLRSNEAETLALKHRREADEAQVALDARTADLRRVEAELERVRDAHQQAGDGVHAAQGRYYEAASGVTAIESEIRVVVESRNRLQAQVAQLEAQHDHWASEITRLATASDEATAALALTAQTIESSEAALAAHADVLPASETEARARNAEVDRLRAEVIGVQKDLEIESTHQRNADRHLESIGARKTRLKQEQQGLGVPDADRMATMQSEVDGLSTTLTARKTELETAEAAFPTLQTARSSAHQALTKESGESAQIEARLAALKHVQERVQANEKLQPWLDRHELGKLPRLWQRLHVESGWETAVEAVLRERLGALEIGQLDRAKAFFDDLPPAKLAIYAERVEVGNEAGATRPTNGSLKPLIDAIELRDPALRNVLGEWLRDIYTADSESDAMARRDALPAGGSFVIKSGHQIGRNNLQLYAADSEQAGMLARQHEIDDLTKRARAQTLLVSDARDQSVRADAAVTQATGALVTMRQAVTALTSDFHVRQMALQRLQQDEAQSRNRSAQIGEELAHLGEEEAKEHEAQRNAEANFERLDLLLAEVQTQFEDAQSFAQDARTAVEAARTRLVELQRAMQEARYEEKTVVVRIADLERQAVLAAEQRARVATDAESVNAELVGLTDETARAGLQDALAVRATSEARLADARAELDALSGQIRQSDEGRLVIERDLDPLRARIADAHLKEQAARITQRQFDDQLSEAAADREALTAFLASDEGRKLRTNGLHGEVQRLQQTIVGLGAVNLAALDELSTARERKTFLDAQTADLGEAIATLEDAIRRIDRETRALLQETFDAINLHFGKLFPALFGGGEAKLVMTGDEILDAGVQVMAQPPGKKNSSIHLLSGGEKALTATALVFAMFQLNPAPFCLLDEVDAPLDDANTERFCNLVKTMSAQTQFLFISHNKIAMEMAQQLIGVTMQEQGVSRIVAVDLESAIGFANERIEEAA